MGLFASSFLAATVLPLGSEAALGALVYSRQQLVAPVLVATVGNFLGACTTYYLGRRAARTFAGLPNAKADARRGRAARLLRRYGQPALLLSFLPVLGDVLVALAGATKMPFGAFSFWVVLGKGLRYLGVAWAALSL